ncbi:TPA: hypothetical protein N0F65_003652 [Lagenidium giganteum]|uniref:Uncharacterized protein n=1 Tax=Lagenidium giganteum TaxID=4803 RepID=A0AAV2YFV6_9STRA|nr:TPA: hypothetical protein N0F65_003652 [Lagenidium giganteum]
MFLPFKNLTNRQSAGYAALCVVLMGGIKYLDEHMPEDNPLAATNDRLVRAEAR